MRLGVLDVGSSTVHLLVVDAHRGAHPTPTHSQKSVLRLAEHVTDNGRLTKRGADALVSAAETARTEAARLGCDDLLAFATSAVRDAVNAGKVLDRVRGEAGVDLQLLTGVEEARLTFLAVRRWFGWSAGRLLVFDIGGGSLEVATGIDEEPDAAVSLPLGSGRLTRERLSGDPPSRSKLAKLVAYVDDLIGSELTEVKAVGHPDRVVATSKTFRSLARLTGAAPSAAGPRVRRELTITGLRQTIAFISRIEADQLAELEGVSSARAHQLLAGAVVAEAAMREVDAEVVEICPWALREGVILRRLDWLSGIDEADTADPIGLSEAESSLA
jgi:exopolyphosphatase / guanosine-5'-triphosphate,3'-diphosphate pyrophosphatase